MNAPVRTVAHLVSVFLAIGAAAPAQNLSTGTTTLVVLADRRVQDHLWPVLVSTLTRDAAAQSEASPIAGSFEIVLAGKNVPGPSFPSRIEVELLGRCDSRWDRNPIHEQGPLGWVVGSSGNISPVIYVDCGRIYETLWLQTQSMDRDQWLEASSEAISHVILHEWIHIATQSPEHASHGIMRPELSPRELTEPITDQ